MSTLPAPNAAATQATWADVNRDVIRTIGMPGDKYFAWMCLVALTLACGVAAWTWQIWVGIGAAGKRTPRCGRCTSPPSCSGSASATRGR